MTHEVVKAVHSATRLPVIPKLSPNVGDISGMGLATQIRTEATGGILARTAATGRSEATAPFRYDASSPSTRP
jgi:dihydroorotate dehydrogenase